MSPFTRSAFTRQLWGPPNRLEALESSKAKSGCSDLKGPGSFPQGSTAATTWAKLFGAQTMC
jgi:hypothetical protein